VGLEIESRGQQLKCWESVAELSFSRRLINSRLCSALLRSRSVSRRQDRERTTENRWIHLLFLLEISWTAGSIKTTDMLSRNVGKKNYHHTLRSLTSYSRILPEKLTCPKLVGKCRAFYEARMLNTPFESTRYLSLSWARPIQPMPSLLFLEDWVS
jgi:hypothetical protein